MTDYAKKISERIKSTILSIEPTAEVILFGSQARGDVHEESDWDVLVLLPNAPYLLGTEARIDNALLQLELETGAVIVSHMFDKKDWESRLSVTSLYESIRLEGIRL